MIFEPFFGKNHGLYSLCFFFKNWPIFKMAITHHLAFVLYCIAHTLLSNFESSLLSLSSLYSLSQHLSVFLLLNGYSVTSCKNTFHCWNLLDMTTLTFYWVLLQRYSILINAQLMILINAHS